MSAERFRWTQAGGFTIVLAPMNSIKFTTSLCTAIVALHGSAFAGGEGWSSDYSAAKSQAAASNKDLLIDFTGSDWCGWCIKLDSEVFKQEPFKAGVKDTFVLVELDYPQDKTKLTAETVKQNQELSTKYAVKGFPTILLCDAQGRPYAATGYEPGGPEKYVELLNQLRGIKAKRDEAFATADKAEGLDKAKALIAALATLTLEDAQVSNFYGDIVTSIGQLDKEDVTGYTKARNAATAKKSAVDASAAAGQKFFGNTIMPLLKAKEYDKALAAVRSYLKENPTTEVEDRVGLLMVVGLASPMEKNDAPAAMAVVDELVKAYPESGLAKNAEKVKGNITSRLEAQGKAAAPAKK